MEKWNGTAWEAVTLDASPLGGYDLKGATYRFTGTVGDTDDPPETVLLAYVRLAEYFALIATEEGAAGLASGADGDYSFQRAPTWAAKAIQLSGAADLLRRWRWLGAG